MVMPGASASLSALERSVNEALVVADVRLASSIDILAATLAEEKMDRLGGKTFLHARHIQPSFAEATRAPAAEGNGRPLGTGKPGRLGFRPPERS
jgi:hypothetical protein